MKKYYKKYRRKYYRGGKKKKKRKRLRLSSSHKVQHFVHTKIGKLCPHCLKKYSLFVLLYYSPSMAECFFFTSHLIKLKLGKENYASSWTIMYSNYQIENGITNHMHKFWNN